MGGPEKDEGRRQHLMPTIVRTLHGAEVHQPRLVRMQLQSELAQPLPKHRRNALGVFPVRKERHKVVAEAHQRAWAAQTWLHLLGEPHIGGVVKKDVAAIRALKTSGFCYGLTY